MDEHKKRPKLEAIFFQTTSGNEPVRDWLKSLTKAEMQTIGEDIKTVQFGWPIGMPLVDNLGNGLWEIRIKLPTKKIARIIFFMDDNNMILVDGFIKKTAQTPTTELNIAKQRKRQYLAN